MKKQTGYMVLEALIAILIFGMLVVAIFPSINFLLARTRRTKEDSQAAVYLQEGMEATYNILTQDPGADLTVFANGNYHLAVEALTEKWLLVSNPLPQPIDIYERTIVLEDVCRDGTGEQKLCPGGEHEMSKKVTTTVCWKDCTPDKTIKAEMVVVKL